jgi:DNA-binding transcriptional regulator YdaS (Cro superfamily)
MSGLPRRKTPQNEDLKQAQEVMLELRRKRGALSQLAVALGVTAQAVHLWEVVPIGRVLDVERITGISRRKLRPDYFAAK